MNEALAQEISALRQQFMHVEAQLWELMERRRDLQSRILALENYNAHMEESEDD